MRVKTKDFKNICVTVPHFVIGLVIVMLFAAKAYAAPTVTSPYVSKGELEFESKTEYVIDGDSDVDGAWEQAFAVGYGFTDFWQAELEAEFAHGGQSDANTDFDKVEFENKFQLTEAGQYWLDFGIKLSYAYALEDNDADEIEGKILFGKDTGNFTHLSNVKIEREVGSNASGETGYGLAWSTSYRYAQEFEPGFEIHSDFGNFDDGFDEQGHSIGPVAYGSFGNFGYDTGVLFGVSNSSPDATLKLVLEYEF